MANSQQFSAGDIVRLRHSIQRGVAFAYVINGTAAFTPLAGSGSPEGVVAADVGATYWDDSGENLWVKNTGSGTTGWVQVTSGTGASSVTLTKSIPNGVADGSVTGLGLSFTPTKLVGLVVSGPPASLVLVANWDDGSLTTDGFDYRLSGVTDSANYHLTFTLLA